MRVSNLVLFDLKTLRIIDKDLLTSSNLNSSNLNLDLTTLKTNQAIF